MKFRTDRPIYLQISEYLAERILKGELQSEERIPAVRDVALELEVNPNTVVKSFLHLEEQQIIIKKRGLGYFVRKDADKLVLASRRKSFMAEQLPQMVHSMLQLGVELSDVEKIYFTLKKQEKALS